VQRSPEDSTACNTRSGVSSKKNCVGDSVIALTFTTSSLAFQLPKEVVHWHIQFFVAIAGLAGGDNISLRARAATSKRDYVIHRQLRGREAALTVMADPTVELIQPPLGLLELSSFLSFPLNPLGIGQLGIEAVVSLGHGISGVASFPW